MKKLILQNIDAFWKGPNAFVRIYFLLLFAAFMGAIMIMYINKNNIDYREPHESVVVTSYGPDGKIIENGVENFNYFLASKIGTFIPIGKNLCIERLGEVSLDDINLALLYFNQQLRQPDAYKITVSNIKLQCIKFLGHDELCGKKTMEKAKILLEKPFTKHDIDAAFNLAIDAAIKCNIEQNVGDARFISIE